MDPITPNHLQVGFVRRPHGVRGLLRVESTTDQPQLRFAPGSTLFHDGLERTVEFAKLQPDGSWLLKLTGVDSRADAAPFQGAELSVPRETDELMRDDLVGFSVETAGSPIGEVEAVENAGSADFLVVSGTPLLVPLVSDLGVSVDRVARKVLIEDLEKLT